MNLGMTTRSTLDDHRGGLRDEPVSSYVQGVIHDADSHVMETAGWLLDHADPSVKDRLDPLWMRGLADFADRALDAVEDLKHTDEGNATLEAELLDRKNWWALGASQPADRSRALDLLGFSSQLVFATHSSRTLLTPIDQAVVASAGGPPPPPTEPDLVYGLVRAHNRAMAAFCADDPRLLAVGWVRMDDPARALAAATEAIALGCAAIEIPAYPVGPRSITHVDHEPFYALLAEAGVPLLFHLGSGGENPPRVYRNTGREVFQDPEGNSDPVRPLRVVGLAPPVEMALAALIFDGVLERHPNLKVGAIELGAVWVPGFLRRLDLAVTLDKKMRGDHGHRPGDLELLPSEYVTRQVRFTPFTDEPLDWVISQTDPSMYLFSSDYPHAEGGTDPYGEFLAALAGFDAAVHEQFFRTNFEWFLGARVPAPAASSR